MQISSVIPQITGLVRSGQISAAQSLAADLTASYPRDKDAWLCRARVAKIAGDFQNVLQSCDHLLGVFPELDAAHIMRVEALIQTGNIAAAIQSLLDLKNMPSASAGFLVQVGDLLTKMSMFDEAFPCYEKAVKLAPDNNAVAFNYAVALNYRGDMAEAEKQYDTILARNPADYDAYYNRATLRKQTHDNNHVAELEQQLKGDIPNHAGHIQVGYALAKELEDLGEYPASFSHLQAAATLRRKHLQYDVRADVATMAEIAGVMDASFLNECDKNLPSPEGGPIFILGMPRSGTTLVDRLITSHSSADSLGEINDLAMAMMMLAGPVNSKSDLIRQSANIDFTKLAETYEKTTRARLKPTPFLTDKTPANFLYIGLIARAMPSARIVHLVRDPVDSCYAMYKTLFGMGHPFSYDFDDLAQYYGAYSQLMDHWRSHLGDRILDVHYEDLVTNTKGESQRILGYCGLDWEDTVLDFHQNSTPSATASAAQVREKVYTSSVGKWQHYKDGLKPLIEALHAAGINTDINPGVSP
ncbi:hypothetical protein GCM10017044_06190 [Kordiimonas sediminis]|uniref:Sulfotransferase family protein n=1 Tax=Kordiimonas sediminis TaxID=1735581 RepID=A0A919ALR2_9PROT|nr:sulfotransferase [Kordiimonas sediminis]GHF14838.1 hypothetical protein GCM10017044_06190 [Kordiimonas sediminis]